MLTDGLIIMLLGMGVVFSFLLIMVGAMVLNAEVIMPLVAKFLPEVEITDEKPVIASKDVEIAVAIAAVKAMG